MNYFIEITEMHTQNCRILSTRGFQCLYRWCDVALKEGEITKEQCERFKSAINTRNLICHSVGKIFNDLEETYNDYKELLEVVKKSKIRKDA